MDGLYPLPLSLFTTSLEEGDTEPPRGLDWRHKPDIRVGKKLNQLELTFSRILDTENVEDETTKQAEPSD